MNLALNVRNCDDHFEDYKEILDRHEKEIEELKNRPIGGGGEPVVMPDIKAGDGLELKDMMNLFACKNPPDNTIKRIYDLENGLKDLNSRFSNLDGLTDRLGNLENRVASLEKRADGSDKRLDTHDIDIDELKKRLTALEGMEMPAPGEPVANLDTNAILKQLTLVKNEFNTFKGEVAEKAPKVDLSALERACKQYTDSEISKLDKDLK